MLARRNVVPPNGDGLVYDKTEFSPIFDRWIVPCRARMSHLAAGRELELSGTPPHITAVQPPSLRAFSPPPAPAPSACALAMNTHLHLTPAYAGTSFTALRPGTADQGSDSSMDEDTMPIAPTRNTGYQPERHAGAYAAGYDVATNPPTVIVHVCRLSVI